SGVRGGARAGRPALRDQPGRGSARSARPVPLDVAARFLPLVAKESPREYDAYALRWLTRWASEKPQATAEQAAEVAASLADLPAEASVARGSSRAELGVACTLDLGLQSLELRSDVAADPVAHDRGKHSRRRKAGN